MRPSGAEDVQVNVAKDSEKPCFQIRAGLETPLRGQCAGNRLLRQVLRLFAVPRHGPGEAHQPRTQPDDLSGEIALLLGTPLTHGGGGDPFSSREYPRPSGLEPRVLTSNRGHGQYNTALKANFPG